MKRKVRSLHGVSNGLVWTADWFDTDGIQQVELHGRPKTPMPPFPGDLLLGVTLADTTGITWVMDVIVLKVGGPGGVFGKSKGMIKQLGQTAVKVS